MWIMGDITIISGIITMLEEIQRKQNCKINEGKGKKNERRIYDL
jgi:hypothetical protein